MDGRVTVYGFQLIKKGDVIRQEFPHLDKLARMNLVHQLTG
jgi:hypothetical protein